MLITCTDRFFSISNRKLYPRTVYVREKLDWLISQTDSMNCTRCAKFLRFRESKSFLDFRVKINSKSTFIDQCNEFRRQIRTNQLPSLFRFFWCVVHSLLLWAFCGTKLAVVLLHQSGCSVGDLYT